MSGTAGGDTNKANILKRAAHKILKKTAFGRGIEQNLKLAYGGKINRVKVPNGVVNSPTTFYNTARGQGVVTDKPVSKAQAVGRTIRARIVLGPELNILFLGIPLAIQAGRTAMKEGQPRRRPHHAPAAATQQHEVRLRIRQHSVSSSSLSSSTASAPFSAEMRDVIDRLVGYGMAEEMAIRVVQDEFEGQDVADVLEGDDLDAMLAFLENELEAKGA